MTNFVRLVALLATAVVLTPSATSASSLRSLAAMEYQAVMASPPLNCFVENGYDYVGNDITNKPGQVGNCCYLCSTTPGCKAWSWSDYNGGTCWLKSGRGDIIVNPNVKSALLSYSVPQYCKLTNDLDYVGNDIARVDSADATGCCDLCQKYAGCRAYSWSDYQGGSCWLKSKVTQTVAKAGVKSAKAYPDDVAPTCSNLDYNTDYAGNDIANKPAVKAELCCDICKGTQGCRAFSWSGHNGGTCWLKSQRGASVYTNGVTSGQVAPNPPQCVLVNNIDYVNYDFANVANKDASACCDICRNKPGCKAFSWSDHQGGTCWLKTAKGTPIAKNGVKSGTI
jgi:hypothetical protein